MKLDIPSEAPAYLNEDFFRHTLENGLRDMRVAIRRIAFDESGCSGGGENYCSKIYRVRVAYRSSRSQQDEEKALIVKSIPITPSTQFLEDCGVFLKEKVFYFDVIDKLELLLGDGTRFGAKCLYTARDPIQTIVFEDLSRVGYRLASRQKGLDEEHCLVMLRKLGKLHAASMVLKERYPSVQQHFVSGMLDEDYVRSNERFINFMTLQLRTMASVVASWQGFENIAAKLHVHCDNIKENLVLAGRPVPGELTVLNHGDLWVNNFMYKYDDTNPKQPSDTLFVDFQTSFFGSPGCDLNFFLNSSVQLDVLMNRRDHLIAAYCESLRGALKRMHYKPLPTLQDIQREVHSRELYGFFSLYSFLPMVAMRKEDSADNSIEAFADMEFARKKVQLMFTSNPRTCDTLRYALRRLDDLGILES